MQQIGQYNRQFSKKFHFFYSINFLTIAGVINTFTVLITPAIVLLKRSRC